MASTQRILNLYYSSTGNTEKVALRIGETLRGLGREVDTVKVTGEDLNVDVLRYGLVFAGSGIYGQLPGEALIGLFRKILAMYSKQGQVKPCSPKKPSAKAVVYCTYGGVHTGVNEAVPGVKFMGQLFDHLGYTVVGEWYFVGEYVSEAQHQHSVIGRLGDIRGRPNEEDLREVAERVKGILKV